jgi:hypothetical protein
MRKRNAIAGQFAARPIKMLESPAFRVLSRGAHQVLARIEIEHAHHGGAENGELPVTYDHFVEHGLHRHAIAPAIRELAALGFIEVTRRGCAMNGDQQQVSLYRLTFRHAKRATGDGTHEWRRITTIEQAEMLAKAARLEVDSRARNLATVRIRKQNASDGFRQPPVPETVTEKANHQWRKPSLQPVSETVTTSISREGRPRLTPPDLATPIPPDAPVSEASNSSKTPAADNKPKLVWTKPVVRELFGDEMLARLAEVNQ